MKKTKLELTWIGKDEIPSLEPRILIEDPEKSYSGKSPGLTDNRVIFGDNLLALKALEQELAGKVKCIFIDPPYNTGSAFEHYDDGIEHSLWLTMMRDRLELLRGLLSEDGSIWITIDDNEAHYLKVLCDEVFGRNNFVSNVVWQKIYTTKNSAQYFSSMHDHVLVFARSKNELWLNELPRGAKQDDAYKNLDADPRGPWKATPLHARNFYGAGRYSIKSPSGRVFEGPPPGTYWRISETNFLRMQSDGQIWWGKDGTAVPSQKRFLSDVKQTVVPATLWLHEEAGHNGEAKNEVREVLPTAGDDLFVTPKPERLLHRILNIATNPGDLVLDSFAGSGTTAAVAHKMGRRFVVVELGEHCHTHILPRLRKVVDGDDPGGITEAVGWKGGGGFRYYRLGPSLLQKDDWGNWIISEKYNGPMLAEALCKLEGFRFDPDPSTYFIHGRSSERDFLYATTQTLTFPQLERLSKDVGKKRSLLVMCGAFKATAAQLDTLANLTVRKIPQAVLSRCEFGKDDYSLKLPEPSADEPEASDDASTTASAHAPTPKKKAKKTVPVQSLPLFDRQAAEKADKKGGRS